jgi:hypothetical protein
MSKTEQLKEVYELLAIAETEFNEAKGLYVDAYSYKVLYLKTLCKAILAEIGGVNNAS